MYAKIFTSIFEGSMRGKSDLILVFVNILCHANRDGVDDRHGRAIADETGLTHERVKAAIMELEGPDHESRSRNEDGRRLKRIDQDRDWGWEIVNYQHYRQLRSEEERREYFRVYKAKQRAVVHNCPQYPPIAEAEAEAKKIKTVAPGSPGAPVTVIPAVAKEPKKQSVSLNPPSIADVVAYVKERGYQIDAETFHAHYTANGWVQGKNKPLFNWKAAVVTWQKNRGAFGKTPAPRNMI